jgi:hypothetical protein
VKYYNKEIESFFGDYLKRVALFLSKEEKRYLVDVMFKERSSSILLKQIYNLKPPISNYTYRVLQDSLSLEISKHKENLGNLVLIDNFIIGKEYSLFVKPFLNSIPTAVFVSLTVMTTTGQKLRLEGTDNSAFALKQIIPIESWIKIKFRIRNGFGYFWTISDVEIL